MKTSSFHMVKYKNILLKFSENDPPSNKQGRPCVLYCNSCFRLLQVGLIEVNNEAFLHCTVVFIFLQHISGAGHSGGRQGSQLVAGDGGEGGVLHFLLCILS